MAVCNIGKYRYQQRTLAEDTVGTLHAGIDTTTQEEVFVKAFRSDGLPGRVGSQAATLRNIAHPHLTRYRDELVEGGALFAVVAKPQGELLRDKLAEMRSGGIWGRYQLLKSISDMCQAVSVLHRNGLVHGAINPATIIVELGAQPRAYLLCFETFVPHPTSYYLRGQGELSCFPQEQLRGGGDFASDMYALGMLLYLGFGAHSPFSGESPYRMAEEVVWGDLPPFVPFLEDLDGALGQAIVADVEAIGAVATKALQRNPAARFGTVMQMHHPLAQMSQRLAPLTLGHALYRDGRHEVAAAVLAAAATAPENFVSANLLLGRVHGMKLGNYAEGVKAYKRILKRDPDLWGAHLGLAELYAEHGRHDLAKGAWTALLMKQPDDPQLLMAYASVLQQSDQPVEALNVLRRVQEVSPYDLNAYLAAIRISANQGDLAAAGVDCRSALKRIVKVIDKGNLAPEQVADIYYWRGWLYHLQGQPAPAFRWLEKALRQQPSHSRTHMLLAELHAIAGNRAKALDHLLQGLRFDPKQRGVMDVITRMFVDEANPQELG